MLLNKVARALVRAGLRFALPWVSDETVVRSLGMLPEKRVYSIKRELASTKRLDYPRSEILISTDSRREYRMRWRASEKEPETVQWIEASIRKGEVFFDVGANIGAYSLIASAHSSGGVKVYAFEPGFATFGQLCRNVVINGYQDSIVPLQVALSSETGLKQFHYRELDSGGASHALGEPRDIVGGFFDPVLSQPVLSYRMDDLIRDFSLPTPNHIKLDVDGHELEVLKGGSRALADVRLRTVLVEICEELEESAKETLELLAGSGLTPESKHQHSGQIFNYIFVRRE